MSGANEKAARASNEDTGRRDRGRLTTDAAFRRIIANPEIARRTAARFWCKVDTSAGSEGCWPWTGCMPSRSRTYGRFGLGGSVTADAHRVAFVLASHGLPERDMVCHHCDNAACVNPTHLYDGYAAENVHDMVTRGRHRPFHSRLEANPNAKLTQFQADAVRSEIALGRKPKEVAAKFGVSTSTVYRIAKGTHWPTPANDAGPTKGG